MFCPADVEPSTLSLAMNGSVPRGAVEGMSVRRRSPAAVLSAVAVSLVLVAVVSRPVPLLLASLKSFCRGAPMSAVAVDFSCAERHASQSQTGT